MRGEVMVAGGRATLAGGLLFISALIALLSSAELLFLAQSYLRRLSTGDQAGFSLGLYLFLSFQVPFAGMFLAWTARQLEWTSAMSGFRRICSVIFGLSAAVVLGFAIFFAVFEMRPHSSYVPPLSQVLLGASYEAVLVALGLFLLTIASSLWSRDEVTWLRLTAGGLLVARLLLTAADLARAYQEGFQRNAPVSPLDGLRMTLLWNVPALVMLALMGWAIATFPKKGPAVLEDGGPQTAGDLA